MFLISKAGLKFGYREMMSMPARRLRKFFYIAQEYFEKLEEENKKAKGKQQTNPNEPVNENI